MAIDDSLIDDAFRANSEYKNALSKEAQRLQAIEAQRKVKEETERLKELARKDKERKSELQRIRCKEDEVKSKRLEAERKSIEAERRLQQAMADFRSANDEKEKAIRNEIKCSTDREA